MSEEGDMFFALTPVTNAATEKWEYTGCAATTTADAATESITSVTFLKHDTTSH